MNFIYNVLYIMYYNIINVCIILFNIIIIIYYTIYYTIIYYYTI